MFAFLLAILPSPDVAVDVVDVVEINHVCDRWTGKEHLVQAIYWRWIPEDRDWRVVDWRLLRTEHQRPVCGQSVWIDGDRLRKVRAAAVIETWTCYDPELDDRRILSECRRWKLSK